MLAYPLYFSAAEDNKISFEELSTQWEENAYPDDVGGVYWDSNKFVITLVHPSDARKQEILSGLSDPGSVAFREAAYYHNQLLSVQRKLRRK